jgi:hypothetical protein
MEIMLKCSQCNNTDFNITTDKLMKIYIEDLECLANEHHTFSFCCVKCEKKITFITGRGSD